MKTLITALSCVLFAAVAFHVPASAQGDLDGGNSIDTLHAAITKSAYTYVKGVYNSSIKFKSNGTGVETNWKFKWHSKDAQTIEVTRLEADGQPSDQKIIITFNADYSAFTCVDVDGVTKVTGHVVAAN